MDIWRICLTDPDTCRLGLLVYRSTLCVDRSVKICSIAMTLCYLSRNIHSEQMQGFSTHPDLGSCTHFSSVGYPPQEGKTATVYIQE